MMGRLKKTVGAVKAYFQDEPIHYNIVLPSNEKVGLYINKNIADEFNDFDIIKGLDIEEYSKISKRCKQILFISFIHRDPFQYDNLFGICDLFYTNNNTRNISIHTNGYDYKKAVRFMDMIHSRCPGLYIKIFICFDDMFAKERNASRGIAKKKHDTIEKLKQYDISNTSFSLQGYVSATKDNVDRLVDITKDVREKFMIKFRVLYNRTNFSDDEIHRFIDGYGECRNYLNRINKRRNMKKGNLNIKRYFYTPLKKVLGLVRGETIIRVLKKGEAPPRCVAGVKSVIMNYNGDIYPCIFLPKLGNVRESLYSIARIIKNTRFKKNCFCAWDSLTELSLIYSPSYIKRIFVMLIKYYKDL